MLSLHVACQPVAAVVRWRLLLPRNITSQEARNYAVQYVPLTWKFIAIFGINTRIVKVPWSCPETVYHGWGCRWLWVENSVTHQRVKLLHRLKTSSNWEYRVVSAPLLCTVGVVIMFYIESHWIRKDTWNPVVHCLFSGCGKNAFRMASSSSSLTEKSCACAYIAFPAGIFSWYADSSSCALPRNS
jgi:hypothetical protein